MSRYRDEEGNRRRNSGTLSSVLLAVCLTLFIFSLSVVLVLNFRWLYYLDIVTLNIEKSSGLTVETIRANYDTLIDYNQLWYRGTLKFPTLAMSEHGAIHFAEVKRIFDGLGITCIATGILSFAGIFSKRRRRDFRYLKISGILTLAIPCVLGILAALNWNRFFIGFHHLFFHNNYWLFDPKTDPVINILPEEYFMHCAVLVLILIAIGALICFRNYRRRRRQ